MNLEPFVKRIVAGGLAVLAGLWTVTLLEPSSTVWLLGPVLLFGGIASLIAGVAQPLD